MKIFKKKWENFIFIQIKDRYLSLLVSLSPCECLQAVLWLLWGITSRITSYPSFKFFTNGNNNSFLKKIWNLHFVFTIMNNYIFRRPGQLIKFRVIMNQFLKQHPDSEGCIMVLFWLYRHLHFCTLINEKSDSSFNLLQTIEIYLWFLSVIKCFKTITYCGNQVDLAQCVYVNNNQLIWFKIL